MARKGYIQKFTLPGSGVATKPFRAEVGTDEAGGTVQKIDVIEVSLRNAAKYQALSANEKTAIRAVTLGDIIDAAFHASVEV